MSRNLPPHQAREVETLQMQHQHVRQRVYRQPLRSPTQKKTDSSNSDSPLRTTRFVQRSDPPIRPMEPDRFRCSKNTFSSKTTVSLFGAPSRFGVMRKSPAFTTHECARTPRFNKTCMCARRHTDSPRLLFTFVTSVRVAASQRLDRRVLLQTSCQRAAALDLQRKIDSRIVRIRTVSACCTHNLATNFPAKNLVDGRCELPLVVLPSPFLEDESQSELYGKTISAENHKVLGKLSRRAQIQRNEVMTGDAVTVLEYVSTWIIHPMLSSVSRCLPIRRCMSSIRCINEYVHINQCVHVNQQVCPSSSTCQFKCAFQTVHVKFPSYNILLEISESGKNLKT